MAVSKTTRYEVLRRDGFTCRYCGAKAPDVEIHVDHVVPVSLGGSDDPTNLVAACRDCNAGKGTTMPDAELVAEVDDRAVRFMAALETAAEMRRQQRRESQLSEVEQAAAFDKVWNVWHYGPNREPVPREDGWQISVNTFHGQGLTLDDMTDFVRIAMRSTSSPAHVWRYFCGCCWNEIKARQEIALKLLDEGEE